MKLDFKETVEQELFLPPINYNRYLKNHETGGFRFIRQVNFLDLRVEKQLHSSWVKSSLRLPLFFFKKGLFDETKSFLFAYLLSMVE